jgi:hypothetical protein
VNCATGHYRLDRASTAFFGSPLMHFIQRGDRVLGHFGRHGIIRGSIVDRTMEAAWKSGERCGWLKIEFDATRRSFEGTYGLGEATSPPLGYCRGGAPSVAV